MQPDCARRAVWVPRGAIDIKRTGHHAQAWADRSLVRGIPNRDRWPQAARVRGRAARTFLRSRPRLSRCFSERVAPLTHRAQTCWERWNQNHSPELCLVAHRFRLTRLRTCDVPSTNWRHQFLAFLVTATRAHRGAGPTVGIQGRSGALGCPPERVTGRTSGLCLVA